MRGVYTDQKKLIGKQFGKWTVLRQSSPRNKFGWTQAVCVCVCGFKRLIPVWYLTNGKTKQCRKCAGEQQMSTLVGNRYGALIVMRRAERHEQPTSNDRNVYWLCACLCAGTKIIRGTDLVQGRTMSCGCGRGRGRH
jgi:hypothetical protein